MNTLKLALELLKSKTIQGLFVVLLGFFVKDNPNLEQAAAGLSDALAAALAGIGGLWAAWGRLTAKGPMVQLAQTPTPFEKAAADASVSPPPGGRVG